MKTISDHIRHVHTKPHHVRRKITLTVAAIGTGLIAIVWLVGSVSSGVFALKDTSFADSVGTASVQVANGDVNAQLAGAAASLKDDEGPARIEIVDIPQESSPKPEQTTIPF
jgi:hypothetical protein